MQMQVQGVIPVGLIIPWQVTSQQSLPTLIGQYIV